LTRPNEMFFDPTSAFLRKVFSEKTVLTRAAKMLPDLT